MNSKHVHIVGFGSQGSAWAQALRASGWTVGVYVRSLESTTASAARSQGFVPKLISDLAPNDDPALIAMLCPDDVISPIYREFLSRIPNRVTLVLAHGFAVYTGDLAHLNEGHEAALLAPKAIGPKLLAAHRGRTGEFHSLVAAFQASSERLAHVAALASGLGFSPQNLVPATFDQETIGDLISEQALLCGPVFNFLEFTVKNMKKAGVPDALIREECLTELELIAGLIRERGPAAAFSAISHAAQCGTIAMREKLEAAGIPAAIEALSRDVVEKRFPLYMKQSEWKQKANDLADRLKRLEIHK